MFPENTSFLCRTFVKVLRSAEQLKRHWFRFAGKAIPKNGRLAVNSLELVRVMISVKVGVRLGLEKELELE